MMNSESQVSKDLSPLQTSKEVDKEKCSSSSSQEKFSSLVLSDVENVNNVLPCPYLPLTPKIEFSSSHDDDGMMQDVIPLSPILPCNSPIRDLCGASPILEHPTKENCNSTWQHNETNDCHIGAAKHQPQDISSPMVHLYTPGNDGIRHRLLVQRTFNNYEGDTELKHSPGKPKAQLSPFLTPYNDNASDFHSVFQTPVRGRQNRHEQGLESTPSYSQHSLTPSRHQHSTTPMGYSYQHAMTPRRLQGSTTPSSRGSPYVFTPGRNFFNPFEIDCGQLHLPVMSPGVFQVAKTPTDEEDENKEPFWSVEHAALMMPVDIKDSDIIKQHYYQVKKDKERDDVVQSAINKFFSNDCLLPSPWSQKTGYSQLPRTPGYLKSVSSQTTLSVPPDVDLFAELGGRYQLPDHKTEPESSTDSVGNSFIRRKLLHQLNENDVAMDSLGASPADSLGGSPILPSRSTASLKFSDASSPIKHASPEWEKQTPHKKNSGHFSSSPIREATGSKEHQPMSESDLLASPELSPIAGKGRKSIRSADIFYSHQDLESPREIMQLDFSSILDEPDELENLSDKAGTLTNSKLASLQQRSRNNNSSSSMLPQQSSLLSSSHINEDGSASSSKLISMMGNRANSGLFAESTTEIATTSTSMPPQSICSQDTGYQTASMQSTVNQEFTSQETLPLSGYVSHNSSDPTRTLIEKEVGANNISLTNQFTGMPFRSDSYPEENSFSLLSGSFKERPHFLSQPGGPVLQKLEFGRIRKVKTMSDMRRSKEKRGASRNLTQSFNEDLSFSLSGSSERLNDSLSNSLNDATERTDTKNAKTKVNTQLFKSQNPNSVLKEKVTNCITKETLVQSNENKSIKNSLSSVPLSYPSDKRSLELIDLRPLRESESKCIKLVTDGDENKVNKGIGDPDFSPGNESALVEARNLLSKSEALRKQLETSRALELESDTFYQFISESSQHEHAEKEFQVDSVTPDQDNRSASQSSILMESLKKKISSVEGSKLGSEIAAEILKRAGDDLAQLKELN